MAVVVALVLCLAAVIVPRGASAQASNNAAAQTLFDAARALMKKGNYAEACPKFEESQRLDPGSGTLLNLGICYEKLGLTASAWTTFIDATAAAKAAGKSDRVKSAQQHADALVPRLSRLTIRVKSDKIAQLEVKRNGMIIRPAQWGTAIAVDPGSILVMATAPGYKSWQTTITLVSGKSETVTVPDLELSPPPPSAKATASPVKPKATAEVAGSAGSSDASTGQGQRTVAIVVGSVALAGVAVGTVFGLRSKSFHDDALAHCSGDKCSQQGVDLVAQARGAGNVSTAAFVLGGVGLIAGSVLWFTAPRSNVEVGVGIGTLQIAGTW
jgi:hypothetical protein